MAASTARRLGDLQGGSALDLALEGQRAVVFAAPKGQTPLIVMAKCLPPLKAERNSRSEPVSRIRRLRADCWLRGWHGALAAGHRHVGFDCMPCSLHITRIRGPLNGEEPMKKGASESDSQCKNVQKTRGDNTLRWSSTPRTMLPPVSTQVFGGSCSGPFCYLGRWQLDTYQICTRLSPCMSASQYSNHSHDCGNVIPFLLEW